MRQLLANSVAFIRENPRILYSVILVVLVPLAFFINTYGIISGFEKNIDRITQDKAVLVEEVINAVVADKLDDVIVLQSLTEKLVRENKAISSVAILRPIEGQETFKVMAASDKTFVGESSGDVQFVLAWRQSEGIASLGSDAEGRFWRVTKMLTDSSDTKRALVSMTFPLKSSDTLIDQTINRAYWLLLGTVLVVLLLVSNQAKLFGHLLTLNKLKEVDKMKDTFVSMASHELRAPLTAMKGYLEFLGEKKDCLDNEGREYLKNVAFSVDRLSTLVNDMLEVSRLQGDRIPFTVTVFDPSPIITQSVEELRSQAIQKGLELNIETGPSVILKADADRLKQIVVNLVGNAIKYTSQGSVTVTSREDNGTYIVTVADTGIGISAEDQQKLFQKFGRIRNEKTQMIAGTGLGLWITLELARRMSGTVTVESIEGVGSHFMLHMPIAKG